MNIWSVLGINETKDKDSIRETYLNMLNEFHPEEDPQGFQKLRTAYEEALNYAEQEENTNETEVDVWMHEVKDVYKDFFRRIEKDQWRELFAHEVCFSLENKEEACIKLLEFLMDNYFIPKDIWLIIDEKFNIRDREAELSERIHKDFVQYAINSTVNETRLNYYLFEMGLGKDYDEFISLYNVINNTFHEKSNEEIDELLNSLKALDIYHPYLITLEMKILLRRDEIERAKELSKLLENKYEDDIEVVYGFAEIYWAEKSFNEALVYYNKILDIKKDHYNAIVGKADCLLELGEYHEAKELYLYIIDKNSYDNYVRNKLYDVTLKIIEEQNIAFENNPEDLELGFKLAWNLYEVGDFDKALDVAIELICGEDKIEEYLDLMGRIFSSTNKYEQALEMYNAWLKKRLDKEVNDEEKGKEIDSYIYYRIGLANHHLNKYEEAIQAFEKVTEIVGERYSNLNYLASTLVKAERYEEAIKICERSLEINNYQAEAHINMARAFKGLGYYRDAIDSCEASIEIYRFFREAYDIQLEIYSRFDKYDEMLEIIKTLEVLDFMDDKFYLYKAEVLMEKNLLEEAKKVTLDVINKIQENKIDDVDIIKEAYYRYSFINMKSSDLVNGLKYINQAIEIDSNILKYYYLRAKIYSDRKEHLNEIEDYKVILKNDPDNKVVNGWISDIYDNLNDEENYLYYLDKQLEVEASEYYLINKGIYYHGKGIYDKAIEYYEEALKVEPESYVAYNNIGRIYYNQKEYYKAIDFLVKSIELSKGKNYSVAYQNLAEVYIKLNKYDEALRCYDDGYNETDEKIGFLGYKANLYTKVEEYDEAIKCCSQILELDKSIEDVYLNLVKAYLYMEDYNKAFEVVELFAVAIEGYNDQVKAAEYIEKQIENYTLREGYKENVLKKIKKVYKKSLFSWLK